MLKIRYQYCFIFSFIFLLFNDTYAKNNLTVDFSIKNAGSAHFSFLASINTTDLPVKYSWNFGDGSTFESTNTNIANHTFSQTGQFNVKLMVQNSTNEKDSVTYTVFAFAKIGINADFTYSPNILYTGDTLHLINTSTSSSGSEAFDLEWYFANGETSRENTVTHEYFWPGTYTILLYARSLTTGADDTTLIQINVLPSKAVICDFDFSPSLICPGTLIEFTGSSYTSNGSISNWHWDFGDGTTGASQYPTHIYTSTGNYVVTLVITNSLGQTDTISHTLTVEPLEQIVKYVCPNSNIYIYPFYYSPTYQWQQSTDSGFTYHDIVNNSNFSGVKQFTLSIKNPPASWYGYKYRCVTDNGIGGEYILEFQNKYIKVNGAWEDAASWSCGSIPDANTDVVITAGTIITINSNAVCRTLAIDPQANVIVTDGHSLTVIH